jgi:hypothetical protein
MTFIFREGVLMHLFRRPFLSKLVFLHNSVMTFGRPSEASMRRLPDGLALTAACIFVFLAAYRIELPGLCMDEVDFVNEARALTTIP